MRLSNAFQIYELVFVFLINYLNISAAWGKGNYFSDYEYPEIQLLFSAKEEANGEKNSKADTVQDKAGFSQILNSESNSFLEASERKKLSNEQLLKPWMRGPCGEDVDKEKARSDDEKVRNPEELKLPEERHASKNNLFEEKPLSEVEERQLLQRGDRPRKIISSYINPEKEPNTDLSEEQPRKMKIRKRMKNQNHNRMSPIIGDSNKRFKNHVLNAWKGDDADLPRYDTGNDIGPKQRKNVVLTNSHEKIYSGSRILPEYEGNIHEYDELAGVLNKNEAMPLNNHPTNTSNVSQTKEGVSSSRQKYEGHRMVNEKMEVTNVRNAITNEPIKLEPTHVKVHNSNEIAFNNDMTPGNRVQSLITENSKLVPGVELSASTPSVIPIQQMKADLMPNVSQTNEVVKNENGMILRQPTRVVQDNHLLLAKPPVKIAGTLIDKHTEDDSEVNIEEKGTKIVKVDQLNNIIQSSTALASTGLPVSLQNIAQSKTQEQGTGNAVQFFEKFDNSPKKKRNVSENKNVKSIEGTREKSPNVAPPEKIEDNKITEKKSHSALIDASIDLDNEETSGSNKSKFFKPQYYSLSKSNSALGMFNNLITKLKPRTVMKKKKMSEEKYNESFKRNVPSTYDLGYDSGYDYYRSKDGKQGDPIRAYYDYENDYDLDYGKDRDYPRVGHLSNSSLAGEKEFYDYDGKSYFNNLSRSRNKLKRKKYRKVEENYRDIFAHPISLDDPELQIVRDDEDELAKKRLHHKNFAARHHREKMGEKEFPRYNRDRYEEVDSLQRSHFKKKKTDPALHPRHNKVEIAKKQAINENEVSDKKIH